MGSISREQRLGSRLFWVGVTVLMFGAAGDIFTIMLRSSDFQPFLSVTFIGFSVMAIGLLRVFAYGKGKDVFARVVPRLRLLMFAYAAVTVLWLVYLIMFLLGGADPIIFQLNIVLQVSVIIMFTVFTWRFKSSVTQRIK